MYRQLIFEQVQRQLINGEKKMFSTNDTGTTGHPLAKKWTWIHTSYHTANLTQMDLTAQYKT